MSRVLRSKSWVKDESGEVWSPDGDPSRKEFYKEHVLRVNFNDMFGAAVALDASLAYCSMKQFEYIVTTSDSNKLELRDASNGEIVKTYNW